MRAHLKEKGTEFGCVGAKTILVVAEAFDKLIEALKNCGATCDCQV